MTDDIIYSFLKNNLRLDSSYEDSDDGRPVQYIELRLKHPDGTEETISSESISR
jgi:hypothetical protein